MKFKTLLLALGLLGLIAFVVAGGTLLHVHVSGKSGLWNEEHDLSLMAALGSAASLLDVAPVVILVLAFVLAAEQRSGRIEGQALHRFGSRGPPLR
jgi:hypothetical protein